MKAILISIQPQWVEKILSGEKRIEIRKTAPRCKLPLDVYIYQTKKKWIYKLFKCLGFGQGKVVAKFTLNKCEEISEEAYSSKDQENFSAWNDFELTQYLLAFRGHY